MERSKAQEAQFKKMTETPIKPLIVSLSIPTIISMLVSSFYNMADTFFVSQLGTSASGAVGIVFPLMVVIQAVGFTFGTGAGALNSRLLGAKKNDEANTITSTAFFTAIFLGLLITVVGITNLDAVMTLIGATETILPYARAYGQYILFGAPFMAASYVLNNVLRSQGRAKLSMFGLAIGGLINVVLDPIFIFVFELGTAGAAIATLISQLISFSILLSFFLRGKSLTFLSVKRISRNWKDYYRIVTTGLPSFARQAMTTVASISLNTMARSYGGDAAISAMAIVSKIYSFIFSALLGFGQGYMPVAGYNFGAKKFTRVREAYLFFVKTGTVIMTSLAVIFFLLAPQIITAFVPGDPTVTKIGAMALRFQCLMMPFVPISTSCNMTFQQIGRSWLATILSFLRQGIWFLPLILTLPRVLDVTGVALSQPLADGLTFLTCLPFAIDFLRKLPKEDQ